MRKIDISGYLYPYNNDLEGFVKDELEKRREAVRSKNTVKLWIIDLLWEIMKWALVGAIIAFIAITLNAFIIAIIIIFSEL